MSFLRLLLLDILLCVSQFNEDDHLSGDVVSVTLDGPYTCDVYCKSESPDVKENSKCVLAYIGTQKTSCGYKRLPDAEKRNPNLPDITCVCQEPVAFGIIYCLFCLYNIYL